jgi:hypothetical protein
MDSINQKSEPETDVKGDVKGKIETVKKNVKTKSQRVAEIVKSWRKLRELGLTDELPALIEFKKVTNQFIEDGIAVTGKIPMPEWDRTLCYMLTNHSIKESTIALMANRK